MSLMRANIRTYTRTLTSLWEVVGVSVDVVEKTFLQIETAM
jgi:hypothetical protein